MCRPIENADVKKLGRHGEVLAPHLQGARCSVGGVPGSLDRGSHQPCGHQGEDDGGHVRGIESPGAIRRQQGRPRPARRTTGLVLDSGYDTTFSVPIYEGYALPYCVQHLGVGGRHVTLHLLQLLSQRGHTLPINIANDIKEKLCHVALDDQNELSSSSGSRGYELPDGKVIFIEGKERLQCPEILFKSGLVGGKDLCGFSEAILRSVDARCDAMLELRRDMYSNIVLSGGNTMYPGLKDRLDHELNAKLSPKYYRCAVIAPSERKLTTWIGGSILGSLSTFQQMWISKEEYGEVGPSIVTRKCF